MSNVIKDGKEAIEWERVDLTYHADGNVGIGTPPQVKSAPLVMGEPVEYMRINMTDGIGVTPGSESTAFSFRQPAQEWARVDKDGNVTHLNMDLCVEGPRNAYTALAVAIWNKAIDECIEIVARHGGSVEIEAAIRARGKK